MADVDQAMMDDRAAAAFIAELQNIKLAEGDTIESLERKLVGLIEQRKQLQEQLRQITGVAGAKNQEEEQDFEKVLTTASQVIFKLEKECASIRDLFVKPSTTPSEMHA